MDRIRLAVVGLNFGSWMIENELLSENARKYVEISAVCDFQEQKAREWGEKLQVPYYLRLEDALADSAVDAVALFTGPIGRASLIEKIVESGRHVITTKPFELDSTKARKALDKARSLGKIVQMNSPAPDLKGDLLQIRRWIDIYDLGRPIAFRAESTCSYREQANGSWYDDPDLCPAAPIFRLGIYLINDLIRFFGDIAEVNVMESRIFTGRPTADNAQLNIRFQNGALGNIFASFCINDQQNYKSAFVMNFERGTVYRNMNPRPHDTNATRLDLVAVRDDSQIIESIETESTTGYQWDVFYRTVLGERTEAPSYHDDIVAGIRVIERMKSRPSAEMNEGPR